MSAALSPAVPSLAKSGPKGCKRSLHRCKKSLRLSLCQQEGEKTDRWKEGLSAHPSSTWSLCYPLKQAKPGPTHQVIGL